MSIDTDFQTPEFLGNTSIILIEPQIPGNIGSVARAIKTMGFSRLILVNPTEYRTVSEARWLAHGAEDVLDGAIEVESVEAALEGISYVVGTTNRGREPWFNPIKSIRDTVPEILGNMQQQQVAILFGREDRGLSNGALEMCHRLVRIPAAIVHPSLNLSQAVMVCAYELFHAAHTPPKPVQLKMAEVNDVERLIIRIFDTLGLTGYVSRPSPETLLRSIRRVFRRSFRLEVRDVGTLHKLCDNIEYFVKHHRGRGVKKEHTKLEDGT